MCIDRSIHNLYHIGELTGVSKFCRYISFTFSYNRKRQDHIQFVSCLSTWYAVQKFRIARTTLVHPDE